MTDWKDATREDSVRVYMVDPHNLDIIRGELTNIILDGCSITQGYYTDTRISGKIQVMESEYIEGSWIRIVHEVESEEYRNELGTFAVSKPSDSWDKGARITDYELQSALWTLTNDLCPNHYSIGAGSYALTVFDNICKMCGREYVHKAGANNYRYTESKIYEMGDSYLSDLFDICDISNNRIGVDGHGRITIEPYRNPSDITPTWELDTDDPRTLVLSESITRDSTEYEAAGRSIVIYSSNDEEIYAQADAPSSSPYSSAKRGYTRAVSHQVNDLSPATKAQAQALANTYLQTDMASTIEWKVSTLYFPAVIGETLNFIMDGEKRKCLIKSIDPINLKTMTMTLTLKEV